MPKHTIAILGGSGFVGRHLCALLAAHGHSVRVFSRRPDACKHLTVLPTVSVEKVDVFNASQLSEASQDCDVMINLVGILNEKGHKGKEFHHVHAELAKIVIDVCKRNAISRLLHMSALNADAKRGNSFYLRTKGMAEDYVHAHGSTDLKVTSFRPSVMFGPYDSFFNRFALLLKYSPGVMVLPSASAQFAPIYVLEVAQMMVDSIDMRDTFGERYDLCGPMVYTLEHLVKYTAQVCEHKRLIIGLSPSLSNIAAHIMEYLPFKPYSVDNYKSALVPSVCKDAFPSLFNVKPTRLEYIVPTYLAPYRKKL